MDFVLYAVNMLARAPKKSDGQEWQLAMVRLQTSMGKRHVEHPLPSAKYRCVATEYAPQSPPLESFDPARLPPVHTALEPWGSRAPPVMQRVAPREHNATATTTRGHVATDDKRGRDVDEARCKEARKEALTKRLSLRRNASLNCIAALALMAQGGNR